MDKINNKTYFLEIHKIKRFAEIINALEGIINLLKFPEAIKNRIMEDLQELKIIINEAKIKEAKPNEGNN